MAKKTRQADRRRGRQESTGRASSGAEGLAGWFKQEVSRRTASQRLGKGLAWASAFGMAGVSLYKFAVDDEDEISYDSLELQRKEGWDVGSTNRPLVFNVGLQKQVDSAGKPFASDLLDANRLIEIYQPRTSQWQPFFVPTLLQSLSQKSLQQQIRPLSTPAMDETYKRAEGLRELISQAENATQTLIIADLPGPSSIALGAALADAAEIIPVFDNWPHPLGVVHAHETLAAMVYYANEVAGKKARLKPNAPAVMLLDSQRLSPYSDDSSQFDNRYLAKLPPPDQLKQRGITSFIYLVRDESQRQELDDINDDFVEYNKNGINVRMLRLWDFAPYDEAVKTPVPGATPTVVRETHYYYGGSPLSHWWFYNNYFYRPYPTVVVVRGGQGVSLPRSSSPPAIRPPVYRPISRPTIFSAARVGGASGIGRARPSGFGRTSVRMSGGRVTGTSAGRSGSFGRSGGWFGG